MPKFTKKVGCLNVGAIPIREQKKPFKIMDALPNDNVPNVATIGIKGSGKTSLIRSLINEAVDKDTKVIFFVGTIHNDPSYDTIVEELEAIGCDVFKWTEIGGTLKTCLTRMIAESEEAKKAAKGKKVKKSKSKKVKYQPLKYLYVFDDISDELKNRDYVELIKRNRHFDAMTITSSQDLKSIAPGARRNMNYYALYPRIEEDILDEVAKNTGVRNLHSNYKDATTEPHSFLLMRNDGRVMRKNGNLESDELSYTPNTKAPPPPMPKKPKLQGKGLNFDPKKWEIPVIKPMYQTQPIFKKAQKPVLVGAGKNKKGLF